MHGARRFSSFILARLAVLAPAMCCGCRYAGLGDPATTGVAPTPDFREPAMDAGSRMAGITPRTLRVLTLNMWAVELPVPRFIKEVSKDIDGRFALLPAKVLETGADVLVFQEVWRDRRKAELIDRFRMLGFPYAAFGNPGAGALQRGMYGNGLLVISRYPLQAASVLRFTKFTRGDEYFTYKGAIKTFVTLPGMGRVEIVDAHLGAVDTELAEGRPDHFNAAQVAVQEEQLGELARFIAADRAHGALVAAMDMNAHYEVFRKGRYEPFFAPAYSMMTCAGERAGAAAGDASCLGLTDTFRASHALDAEPAWTYDTKSNPYAKNGIFAAEPPGVIDYVFVNDNPIVVPVCSEVVFGGELTDADRRRAGLGPRVPLPKRLSDHYGVLTTFEIRAATVTAAGGALRREAP
jgi:endonuclease/exonuclease/phosphatase family metal-dependent hydrolase